MIVLAVLLLLVVALVVVFVVVTGLTPTVTLDWSQINTQFTLTAFALFLLGAATLLVAEAGLALLLRGNRKSWERRRELKRLRRVESERARHEAPSDTGHRPGHEPGSAPGATPLAEAPGGADERATGERGSGTTRS